MAGWASYQSKIITVIVSCIQRPRPRFAGSSIYDQKLQLQVEGLGPWVYTEKTTFNQLLCQSTVFNLYKKEVVLRIKPWFGNIDNRSDRPRIENFPISIPTIHGVSKSWNETIDFGAFQINLQVFIYPKNNSAVSTLSSVAKIGRDAI